MMYALLIVESSSMLKSSVISDIWSASALDRSLFCRGSREFEVPASACCEIVRKSVSMVVLDVDVGSDAGAGIDVAIESMNTSSTPANRRASVEASVLGRVLRATKVAYGRLRHMRGRKTSISTV